MNVTDWIKQNYKFLVITLVVLICGVAATWLIVSKQASPEQVELASVKASVGRLMLLPKDEEPTLAIVEDTTKLKDKFLMNKTKNGDQVLIYTNNGQAIVYRPSIHKIVAVSPVTVDLALAESNGTTITILNGTDDSSIAGKVEAEIKAKYPDATIKLGKANRRDFPTTIIVDNTNSKDELVEGLVGLIKAQRGVIPLGEDKGSTNLVIIIGKDRL